MINILHLHVWNCYTWKDF